MINKRKNNKGITLLALVVTVIIMIILAAVSINAAIGEDGILGETKKTKELADEVKLKEELEEVLIGFNSSSYVDEANGLEKYLSLALGNGKIDNYLSSTDGEIVILEKDGRFFQWKKEGEDNTTFVIDDMDESMNDVLEEDARLSGNVRTPTTIITQQTLDEAGGFTFANGSTYVVLDPNLKGDNFDFNIPCGDPVTIKIAYNMDIDNKDASDRAAINLASGVDANGKNATLNLYVYGVTNVNSSYGQAGETANGVGAKGGPGGSAGIHVPKTATLNLYGTGTLTAIGGDAGDGGGAYTTHTGGGGGGGAGAGIGGNGGRGGNANIDNLTNSTDMSFRRKQSGDDGEPGEDCGTVNIYNSLKVYAYGGGGGGAVYPSDGNNSSGGGAGGYPAAGIGGGGAGGGAGDHANGGGGYTGGTGETNTNTYHNGNPGVGTSWGGGGGYFGQGSMTGDTGTNKGKMQGNPFGATGGQGGSRCINNVHTTSWYKTCGGDGGIAGKGGNIKVSTNAKIYAYNGNRYTDGAAGHEAPITKKANQCPIYCQNGQLLAVYKYNYFWTKEPYRTYSYWQGILGNTINTAIQNATFASDTYGETEGKSLLLRAARSSTKLSYRNTDNGNSIYGVGSGAGYVELDNGTYQTDANMR